MPHSAPPGWTIQQAFDRTLEPRHWREFLLANEAWRGCLRDQRPSSDQDTSDDAPAGNTSAQCEIERQLHQKHQSAHATVVKGFRDHLINGRLVAWGRRQSPSAEFSPIATSAWNTLKFDFAKSTAGRAGKAADRFFDVQIYPVLLSPQVAEIVSGMSLRDTVARYVFMDPELVTAAKRCLEPAEVGYAFGLSPNSSRLSWTKWHLNVPKQEFAFQPLEVRSFYEPVLPFDMVTLVKPVLPLILDRLDALKRLLANGDLVGEGLFIATGAHTNIPAAQWTRRSVWVDAREGDLIEDATSHTSLRWNGVSLRAGFPVKRAEPVSSPPNTTPTIEAELVRSKSLIVAQGKVDLNGECVALLVELMQASPDERTHTKTQCREMASGRWPALSKLSFDDAWRQAIRLSGAGAWAAAGAPKRHRTKSP